MTAPAPWQDRADPIGAALTEALRLAGRGLPCFPCKADKTPSCPRGFKAATRDPASLRALWKLYPGVLIGVPTGAASGLFCIDLDTGKHDEASEWLDTNIARLPETRRHQTKSGG